MGTTSQTFRQFQVGLVSRAHLPVWVKKSPTGTRVFATAVRVIADDRVANRRTVHPDLMTSAGDELQQNFGRGIWHKHATL